jgi:hypothetical protein
MCIAKHSQPHTKQKIWKKPYQNRLKNNAIYIYATFTKTTRIVIMVLDFQGNVVSIVQIAALILLIFCEQLSISYNLMDDFNNFSCFEKKETTTCPALYDKDLHRRLWNKNESLLGLAS